jgi:FkbM family methyltransferase
MIMRQIAEKLLLKTCCSLTGGQSPGGYRTRVLSGPLRGLKFSMPRLERLSFALGTYERHVVQCMESYVRPGTVAYDVGANAGYMTLVLSKLVGSEGRVIAFEPDPKNARALQLNIDDNSRGNVTLLQRAVSDQNGDLTFATFDYSLIGHIVNEWTPSDAQLITVSSCSLDDLVFNEGLPLPQFIKISIAGAEDKVIRGALRLLDEARPVVVSAINVAIEAARKRDEVAMIFKDRGYREMPVAGGYNTDVSTGVLFVPNEASAARSQLS